MTSLEKLFYLPRKAQQNNYSPDTFGWGGRHDPTLPGNSNLIVPLVYKGISFPGGVHKDFYHIAHNLLQDLEPHIPGGMVAGECGGYVNRNIRGQSDRSFHSWGIAIDINWTQNPMGEASNYGHKHVLPHVTGRIARRWGCQWGGTWSGRRDAMHIECHVSPEVAKNVRLHSRRTHIFL